MNDDGAFEDPTAIELVANSATARRELALARRAHADITLCMIVRNEAPVIAECLASVRPLVTRWVVVDTGSTDGTQEIVRLHMAGMPGTLVERPWRDFATNRNEALELAREFSDYVLVVDADDRIVVPSGYVLPPLTADAYELLVRYGDVQYWRTQLFRSRLDYRYEGPVHEVLVSPSPGRKSERLADLDYIVGTRGARSRDPETYRRDAEILGRALAADPTNARYAFYTAQSWRDAGELALAREVYRHAAELDGWDEQTFFSLLEVARCTQHLGDPAAEVIHAYLAAFERRPTRAEPLCYLAMYLRMADRIRAAYPFACAALSIPRPPDVLFVDAAVYTWRARDEFAVSAYWVGDVRSALVVNRELLAGGDLPASERERVTKNLGFCLDKLGGAP